MRSKHHLIAGIVKQVLIALGYGLVGGIAVAVVLYVYELQSRPPLGPWHTADLDEEFRAGLAKDSVKTLDDYLRLEQRLFDELNEEVYARVSPGDRNALLRFTAGSPADPEGFSPNWNRTFELRQPQPRAGVLLIHGLSDSPYSMRTLAETLHARGAWVVGLRVPGHGTAPVGLTDIRWQDFVAATHIAAAHVAERVGDDRPFYIVGFSNGAALAVEYTLTVLEGEESRLPDRLALLSPAIGITRAAVLAGWQARLSTLLDMKQLAWESQSPEYDPFKYLSFAINAGEQMYLLTEEIASRIERLKGDSGIDGFPALIAFQSLVDATVLPEALVNRLMRNLGSGNHELVLFDVNRSANLAPFLRSGKEQLREELLADGDLPFRFTLVTNVDAQSENVMARHKAPHSMTLGDEPLGLAWPKGIYSLTHVALPFPPDDGLYGYAAPASNAELNLGRLEPRGERGVLIVSPGGLLRLRSNPFFPYIEQRMLDFFQLSAGTE